jgi:hypothetical protein
MSEFVTEGDVALERLATAVRRITSVTVGRPIADAVLDEASSTLENLADTLEAAAENRKRPRTQPSADIDPREIFPTSPVVGAANPVAPPAYIWAVEGESGVREIRGEVTFGYQYEGPPTCVHGGAIAALFDELLGACNIIADRAGMTGTLTVRYRKPTPLLQKLDVVARHERQEGRKSFAWGGIYCNGELTAEAEGIFIMMNPSRMLEMVQANAKATSAPVVDPGFIDLVAERKSESS